MMKKIISFSLVFSVLLLVFFIPVYAQSNSTAYLYYNRFKDLYIEDEQWLDEIEYDEVFYHQTNESKIDWVLVYGSVYGPNPRSSYAVIGDRISLQGEYSPFAVKYAVYDIYNDTFIDICDIDDFSMYSGLEDEINALELGLPIGDCDFDGELTILDATYIQMVIADLCDFKYEDDLSEYYSLRGELKYISDIDRDGDRTIMDATAVQMSLAKL